MKCYEDISIFGRDLQDECMRLKICKESKPACNTSSEIAVRYIAKRVDDFFAFLSFSTIIKIVSTVFVAMLIWKVIYQ